jgi:hypothetical protein
VKRRLLHVVNKKPYLRLANKKKNDGLKNTHWTEELCLEGKHPGVNFLLLTLELVFCGYYLMKLPVEDL